MKERRLTKMSSSIIIITIVAVFGLSGVGNALSYKFSGDTSLDIDVTTKYGISMRVASQDSKLLSNINGDDGNRAFDQGDVTGSRFSMTADIDLRKGDFGVFIRPLIYYDYAYDGTSANDSPGTFNNSTAYGGSVGYHQLFDDSTQDAHLSNAEMLDYFVYGNFSVGKMPITLRVGNQVVAWGESMFIPGVSAAMGPADATAATAPSTEVKEILLPVPQVYGIFNITQNINLSAYYQFGWEKTRLNEVGSFFSTTDLMDEAGERLLVPMGAQMATVDRVEDEEASDSGQYGVSIRYLAEWLNATEFALYYINYHSKEPELISGFSGGTISQAWGGNVVGAMMDGSSYHLKYTEDIKLYGVSFGTNIMDCYVGGEVTYRDGLPISIKDATRPLQTGYVYAEAIQAQIAAIYTLGKFPGVFRNLMDESMLVCEFGYNQVFGYGNADISNDKWAFGGTVRYTPTKYGVIQNVDIDFPITYKWNPKGDSSINGTFTEGADQFAFGIHLIVSNKYLIDFDYVNFLGDASDNTSCDRDYVSASIKYTF